MGWQGWGDDTIFIWENQRNNLEGPGINEIINEKVSSFSFKYKDTWYSLLAPRILIIDLSYPVLKEYDPIAHIIRLACRLVSSTDNGSHHQELGVRKVGREGGWVVSPDTFLSVTAVWYPDH